MNILVLTDEIYPDAIGGVGKSLYNECVAMARRGMTVTVLVRAIDRNLPAESLIEGVQIMRFYGPQRGSRLYYLYPLWSFILVTRYLRTYPHTYDLLYIHSPLFMPPIIIAGGNRRVPVVSTFYAPADDYINSNLERGKYGALSQFARVGAWGFGQLERWALNRVDAVLPRSDYSLDILSRLFPRATIAQANDLIPLGVDIQKYVPMVRAAARTRLGLPAERPILITVRRLDGRMGLENLIIAMNTVRTQHPGALLLIGGKGYLRPKLEALIEERGLENNVRLLGFVGENDLPAYLAAADLFVLPTESLEGFGLATIEAMAAGTPVMGTPVGATPELLNAIDPALVTRDTTAAALSDSIIYWLNRPAELSALGERCRTEAETRYNADEVAAQLETFFTKVISKRQRL